jgi:hypothetical protein
MSVIEQTIGVGPSLRLSLNPAVWPPCARNDKSRPMKCSSQLDQIPGAASTLADVNMNAYERALAQEQMDQAMMIAELVLASAARIRNALNSAGHAIRGAVYRSEGIGVSR